MTSSSACERAALATKAGEKTVLAVRLADRAGILLRGKERTTWLNGLVTCELAKLEPGEGAYGLLVEKKGRIQTDFFAIPSKDAETLVLVVPSHLRESLVATLDHYLIMEDVELEPVDLTFWQLHGPASSGVIDVISPAYAGKLDQLGHGGAVIGSVATDVTDRISMAVGNAGGEVADEATWEAVRIAHGLPRFGVEVDTTQYPQEASLEKTAVSFEKGCYLGQEVVYMLENRGHVKRKLVPLDIDGTGSLAPGDAVATPEGAAVGDVKSATISPNGTSSVAIAMIKWAQTKSGTELRIGDRIARVR